MQESVAKLVAVAPKFTETMDDAALDAASTLVLQLAGPYGEDDVRALFSLLPADDDDAYGLNWMILHAIESSPAWPLWDLLEDRSHAWADRFARSLANAGLHPPR